MSLCSPSKNYVHIFRIIILNILINLPTNLYDVSIWRIVTALMTHARLIDTMKQTEIILIQRSIFNLYS